MMSLIANLTEPSLGSCSGCQGSLLSSDLMSSSLSVVLEWLAWHMVVIISDGKYIPNWKENENSTRKLVLYSIDARNSSDVEWMLDNHSDPTQDSILFLIICSNSARIEEILYKVNIHETYSDEQGVLTYHHRWLIVANKSIDLQDLENHVINITHLSVLYVGGSPENGYIYAAMWEPWGRQFRFSARVVNNSLSGEIFPTLKYGLNGRTFRVSTKEWGPFTGKDRTKEGNARFSGYCIEILKAVAEKMNFTYIILEPPDGEWGDIVNGTWTGLIGQLAYKDTDMMSAAASIQVNRESVMDGSFPFYIEETGVLYKYNPSFISKAFLFVRPYKWQVWICMIALIPTTALLVYGLGWIAARLIYQHDKDFLPLPVTENIWRTYGYACNQSATHLPSSLMVRTVVAFWILTGMIFAATYSGNLVALLAVEVEVPPFNSLEELSVQQEYRFGVQGGTAYTSIIGNSPGVYETMWKRMIEWDKQNHPVLSTSHKAHMEYVDKGGYAYFTDLTEAISYSQTSCDLRIYSGNLFPLQFAMGFQNNSAYRREAGNIVMRLSQSGVLTKWKMQFWPKQTACSQSSPSSIGINVRDLSGLFFVGIGLLVLSAGVLVIERLFVVTRGPRGKGQDNQLKKTVRLNSENP